MLLAGICLATLAGCVSAPPAPLAPPAPPAPAPWSGLPPRPAILGVQYATSTGGAGFEVAEVFIVNPGPSPVAFTNAVLDGIELSGSRDASARLAAKRFRFDIGGRGLPPPPPPVADPRVVWSQFNPAPTIPPGGSGLFQIGFRDKTAQTGSFHLALNAADGTRLETAIPRFTPPHRRIMAVAWSADGAIANIQCTRGAPPKSISVNGVPVREFRALESAGKGRPVAVAARLPRPARTGDNILLELDFGAGGVRRTFLRALPGIVLDAPNGWKDMEPLPPAIRRQYGFDDRQSVMRLPFDVACDDTRAGKHGNSAPDVVAARLKAWQETPDRLCGVDFCTAMYAAIWNLYAPIADAVFVKPYQLHWGPAPARFIENEDARIAAAVAAAAPRPVIWIPERFKRSRHLEGRELETLAWTALLRGAKGVRYHFWMNNLEAPFADCADIAEILPGLNRDIGGLRPILSALIPMGTGEDRNQMTLTCEGWSGDAGALLLVRNMRYTTDGESNDNGRNPRFRVAADDDVAVAFAPPPWLRMGKPVDPLTGEALPFTQNPDGKSSIILPHLDAFRLVWIPNTDPKAFLHLR